MANNRQLDNIENGGGGNVIVLTPINLDKNRNLIYYKDIDNITSNNYNERLEAMGLKLLSNSENLVWDSDKKILYSNNNDIELEIINGEIPDYIKFKSADYKKYIKSKGNMLTVLNDEDGYVEVVYEINNPQDNINYTINTPLKSGNQNNNVGYYYSITNEKGQDRENQCVVEESDYQISFTTSIKEKIYITIFTLCPCLFLGSAHYTQVQVQSYRVEEYNYFPSECLISTNDNISSKPLNNVAYSQEIVDDFRVNNQKLYCIINSDRTNKDNSFNRKNYSGDKEEDYDYLQWRCATSEPIVLFENFTNRNSVPEDTWEIRGEYLLKNSILNRYVGPNASFVLFTRDAKNYEITRAFGTSSTDINDPIAFEENSTITSYMIIRSLDSMLPKNKNDYYVSKSGSYRFGNFTNSSSAKTFYQKWKDDYAPRIEITPTITTKKYNDNVFSFSSMSNSSSAIDTLDSWVNKKTIQLYIPWNILGPGGFQNDSGGSRRNYDCSIEISLNENLYSSGEYECVRYVRDNDHYYSTDEDEVEKKVVKWKGKDVEIDPIIHLQWSSSGGSDIINGIYNLYTSDTWVLLKDFVELNMKNYPTLGFLPEESYSITSSPLCFDLRSCITDNRKENSSLDLFSYAKLWQTISPSVYGLIPKKINLLNTETTKINHPIEKLYNGSTLPQQYEVQKLHAVEDGVSHRTITQGMDWNCVCNEQLDKAYCLVVVNISA